ncbi:MAG: PEP-CTERM sorting domain-containing protein [bacterium]
MKKFLICTAMIMALIMTGGKATAVLFGDGGVGLQTVLDNITLGPYPGISSTNVLTDALTDNMDSYWSIHTSLGSVISMIIEETIWAGTNTFGVYDADDPTKRIPIWGPATTKYQALLSILSDGSVIVNFVDSGIDFTGNKIGYYLDSTAGHPGWTGGAWYSDSSLNADGMDHMVAYQGKGIDTVQILQSAPGLWDTDEHIFAFEDLHSMHWGNGNGINDGYPEWSDIEPDFTDFVFMVESADLAEYPDLTTPEPATILLLSLGFIGIVGINRKKFTG